LAQTLPGQNIELKGELGAAKTTPGMSANSPEIQKAIFFINQIITTAKILVKIIAEFLGIAIIYI
jgi:hypothetical protein